MKEKYHGDLKLAEIQIENGNCSVITKEQLLEIKNKPLLQHSIDEYMTIFNIYKGFHKKAEPKIQKVDLSDSQLEDLSQLIAFSQNNTQLVMCISSIQ